MKTIKSITITLFILVSLLVGSLSYGQVKNGKTCYCDSISLTKYEPEGYVLSGIGREIRLNGKWCEDTFHFPPTKRLKRIEDTIIDHPSYDTLICVLYVMTCKTCEPTITAAYKVLETPHPYTVAMYKDTKTGKHYQGNDGWGGQYVAGNTTLTYLTVDKLKFPPTTFIVKEKELK